MIRICFVCHGNICRSVSAQYILQDLVEQKGEGLKYQIDSAATSREEIGNPIYPPMERALKKQGIPIGTHRARQLVWSDYACYDLFIGMDEENLYYMKEILHQDPDHKVHALMEYTNHPQERIADPWYTRQFDACTLQLKKGCLGLLNHLEKGEKQ